jgi:hypothetical protein
MSHRQLSGQRAQRWAPDLGAARLVGGGRTTAMLRRDAVVRWWCAPDFDDAPFCWQLLDPDGGVAAFPDLTYFDADAGPAGISSDCCPRCPSRRCRGWTPTALTPLVRRMPCCARLTAVWGSRVPGCRWRWWAWAVPCGIDSSRGSPRPAGQERARCRGGLFLTAEQLTKHKRVCSWGVATAALLVATVPAAVPEARAAWRSLRS